ncbi:hypothetical protein [Fictibacillus phosphorivorans]|uniref:hypothetical protein n=1 Tax=Fictibacillus phosphorivorans TaxID=1221500 RepID=UPI00119D2868|nr:hypothetical protein [Fictibacillus phosphorivorans]
MNKKLPQFMNDIKNLNASEEVLDSFLVKLRQAQLEYKNSMEKFSSWTAGEGATNIHQRSEEFFSELAKHIHRIEESQIEILETKRRLESLMKAEINSGPKW